MLDTAFAPIPIGRSAHTKRGNQTPQFNSDGFVQPPQVADAQPVKGGQGNGTSRFAARASISISPQ
jgi:hypothetical protein